VKASAPWQSVRKNVSHATLLFSRTFLFTLGRIRRRAVLVIKGLQRFHPRKGKPVARLGRKAKGRGGACFRSNAA